MADILRVSILGDMPGGEEWSVNPVWKIGGDLGAPVSAALALTIATAIAAVTVPTAILSNNPPVVSVKGCRVEARSHSGILESQAEALKGSPATGTGSSPHPFQTSLVASLRTALPGASGRGRLYWPALSVVLTAATLRVPSATVTSFLGGVKTYLSAIETAIDASLTGTTLAVWSRKNSSSQDVTSLQMGDIVDSQRRRRDVLIESYTATTWP